MKIFIETLFLAILVPSIASGLPAGGKVVGGNAKITQVNGKTLQIDQSSQKAIVNWKGFNIDLNELVKITQPGSQSVILNRVTGVDPSSILGRLVANGRVFIVNPNGVLFGKNSVVDVGGLLATTLNIKDSDFMAGKLNFTQEPGQERSYVINQGQIKVSDSGFVFLIAPGVKNEGLILANLGKVVMGAGEKLTVDFMGDGLVTFAVEGKVLEHVKGPDGTPLNSAVSNTGSIKADGGQIVLSARASAEIFSSVVNNSGVIEARSLVNRGGIIRLEGSDPVANIGEIGWKANLGKAQNADGRVLNSGTLDVSAAQAGAAQGAVTLSGQTVGSSGSILARGADGAQGGRVLVTSSDRTVITQDGVIDVSGVGNSNAGNSVIWSDKDTVFSGTILAKGGNAGGNGGQIEVSGHENLGFNGQVNALAPIGNTGSLLLDPRNITVATLGATANLSDVDQFSDAPAVNQTIAPATINAAAANVTLQANNDITVTNDIAMTNAGVGISMQAGRSIAVNASVSTNDGNISLSANDSAAIAANRSAGVGNVTFGAAGGLSAGHGDISMSIGPSTTAPFSPGSITTVRNLTTTTGNIAINSPNTVSASGALNAGSGTVTIGANQDGAGGQGFTMAAGSSITTSNTTGSAVQINVNAAGGGTGTAALRDITTGSGGTLTVATNTGGNLTGGDITQTAGTLLNVGSGTINLSTAPITNANIGTSGANILTAAGTINASTGTSGIFITETNGADFTATATGGGAITLTSSTGALNISGPSSTGSGAITLTAETVNIDNTLASTGALAINPVNAAGNLLVSSSSSANLTDGFSSITIGNAAGTGAVTVNELTVSDPLTIRAPTTTGTVTVNGAITGLGNGSVTLTGGTGATPITLNAGITTAGNAITLNDNVGLGANVTLDSTNGGGSPAGATISVAGTVNADLAANNRTLTLNSGTVGNTTLSGAVGSTQALQNLTVTHSNALSMQAVTTAGDIQLNAQNAVTLNNALNAGSGTVTIGANQDGAGAQGFTMAAGSSITTSNTTGSAVQINVNAAGGGTGTAALRDITTGSGGTLTVATNTGGNLTGGDITQTAGTLLNVGSGTINLSTAPITNANIGTSGANILTEAGTINASTGTSGIFITETNGADFTATATGGGAITLTSSTGALNISGPSSTGSGAITLTAETVNIDNTLASTGALAINPVNAAGNLLVSSSSSANLTDGFSSITIGNAAGTGAVTVNELTVSDPLTIRAPTTTGTVTVNGAITGLGNGSVTLTGGTGATPITLNAGITTAGNAITLNDNVGLGANVTLDSTNGGGSPAGATISVAGTVNADLAANNRTLTLNSGTVGNTTLSGAVGSTQALQNLTVTHSNALSMQAVTTAGDIQLNAQNAVTLNNALNAGSGTVTIGANQDGAGGQGFTMAAGSSITTSNTTGSAVQINVNAAGGGTGTAALRDITTGSGGTLTVATNTGGNLTGGDITQTAGTLLNVGSGTINLSTAPITNANIGTSGANILTAAGTINASTGTSGIFITETNGADFTATATGGGAITLTSSTGALNISGPSSTGSGAITLTAETVNIDNTLASTGALAINPVNAAGNLLVSSSSSANLTDGFSSITIGNAAGTGAVTVNELTVSDPLTIRAPTTTGTVTVNGAITGLGNGSVTLTGGTGATPITLNAGITTAGNAITLNDNVGLGANVTLDSTNGGGSPAGATISVAGTVNADLAANNRTLTLNSGTVGNTTLSGAVGSTQALQNLTVTHSNALSMQAVTTAGDIQLNAQNAVTLNNALNAGSGTVTIGANQDGAGGQGFTMAAGSSITTSNTTGSAVQINVNAAGGGTGTAALRDITTGSGGTLTVATNTGGNLTGGDITQTAGTLLNVGSGTINLSTAPITNANIGTSGANILTAAGTINASTGTSGIFITETNGADFTATATGGGAITLTSSTGALNISGPSSTGSGAITLTAETVNIDNTLASTGALAINPVNAAGNLLVSSSSSANLTDGFSSITIGNAAGTGAVTVNELTVSDPLTIRAPTTTGTVTVNGAITGLGNGSVTLTGGTGATPITLNAGITTAGNAITLNDNVGLGANVTLDSTNGGGSPAGATISVAGTVNADLAANNRTLTLNSGTVGNTTLSGAVGSTQALQNLTVTHSNALSMQAVTTAGDIQLNAQNAVTLNNALNAGSGTVTIGANQDGAGGQGFTMAAGSSITTSNTTGSAVQINVNAAGGGTGTAALRDITTGSGGTLTVATNTGGNLTGGDITQTAGTLLNVGSGTINLSTAPITNANIGTSGANILTAAGTINASTGTDGVFITESDGATISASASGTGPINIGSTAGDVIVDTISTPGGSVNLSAVAGAIQDGNGGLNNITGDSLTASSLTGISLNTTINNLASVDVTGAGNIIILNSGALVITNASAVNGNIVISNTNGDMTINTLTALAGGIDLTANGGSILDGNGVVNNLTAVTDSALRALGGVVGLAADAIEVDINGGALGVAATGQVTGVSANINGTVLPSDTLATLNSPPGQVIFNGRVINPRPPSIDQERLFRATADLNPQRVSELRYYSNLLLWVLGEDLLEGEEASCEVDESLEIVVDSSFCRGMKMKRDEVENTPAP